MPLSSKSINAIHYIVLSKEVCNIGDTVLHIRELCQSAKEFYDFVLAQGAQKVLVKVKNV